MVHEGCGGDICFSPWCSATKRSFYEKGKKKTDRITNCAQVAPRVLENIWSPCVTVDLCDELYLCLWILITAAQIFQDIVLADYRCYLYKCLQIFYYSQRVKWLWTESTVNNQWWWCLTVSPPLSDNSMSSLDCKYWISLHSCVPHWTCNISISYNLRKCILSSRQWWWMLAS